MYQQHYLADALKIRKTKIINKEVILSLLIPILAGSLLLSLLLVSLTCFLFGSSYRTISHEYVWMQKIEREIETMPVKDQGIVAWQDLEEGEYKI